MRTDAWLQAMVWLDSIVNGMLSDGGDVEFQVSIGWSALIGADGRW